MVASTKRTVESRELGYGPVVNSLLPDLYLLDPRQFQRPVQYMLPQFNFPLPEGFSILLVPTEPRNSTLAIGAPLIEELSLSLVPLEPRTHITRRTEKGRVNGRGNMYNTKIRIPINQTTSGQPKRTSIPQMNYPMEWMSAKITSQNPPNPTAGAIAC